MTDQCLALPQCPGNSLVQSGICSVCSTTMADASNSRGVCRHSSFWWQWSSDVYGQATLSSTPYMTNPHTVWSQSGEGLVDTSSILSQRQVIEAPPPLTADSFDRSSGESEAIPGNQRSGYNQITLTRCPPEWGVDSWGGNVQLCHSRVIDPFSSKMHSNQIPRQQWEAPKAAHQDPELGGARISDNRGKARVYYCTSCSKVYSRLQELKRHVRDRHEERRKCPFCRTRWTRPERVRNHVLRNHGRLLSENEQREIYRLRGLDDTVYFLAKYGNMPSKNHTIDAQAPGLPQPF
ncbi:hypothetical protein EDB89DRAFT_1910630 [Lactarius sanguifluus]|nr:hypothetical protein EDB89DRAFT_1910630 [Lactarius sanguifluus]